MSNKTVLTEFQIGNIAATNWDRDTIQCLEFARDIEQAVLNSEQVQAWKRDAERYRWLRHGDNDEKVLCNGPCDKSYWYLLRAEKLDAAIDAAMEKSK